MENVNVIIITQARLGSTRFPAKVLAKLGDATMLAVHLKRLKLSKWGKKIIVATTHEEGVEKILGIAEAEDVLAFQGSTEDVLDRFYQAAASLQPDYIVRVTADCPLIDAELIDQVIELAVMNDVDYASNMLVEEFPDGQDIEVIRFAALEQAWKEATLRSDREHVTPYIWKQVDFKGGHLFKAKNLHAPFNGNKIRMTVDEPSDMEAIELLIKELGLKRSWRSYAEYIIKNLDKFPNQTIIRNEGYLKSLLSQ